MKFGLGKADKGLLRCYLLRTTGLSRTQLARLVARYLADGWGGYEVVDT